MCRERRKRKGHGQEFSVEIFHMTVHILNVYTSWMTTRAAWECKSVHEVACSVLKGLPEHFAECPASGLATLVQSHLHRTEGRVCQLSLIFQKEGYIVERVAHGKSNG